MSNVHIFRSRAATARPPRPDAAIIRDEIEAAALAAMDAADRLIAVLDAMDGDTDREDSGDAEPSLGAPENHHGSQVVRLPGNDGDREAEALEAVPPIAVEDQEVIPFATLPWRGSGNVVAAAGMALLNMVGGR